MNNVIIELRRDVRATLEPDECSNACDFFDQYYTRERHVPYCSQDLAKDLQVDEEDQAVRIGPDKKCPKPGLYTITPL